MLHQGRQSVKIIPVIDILNGIVVHAVKGKRENYQPLKSAIYKFTDPVTLACAFEFYGFKEVYIADLNAILKSKNNFLIIEKIRKNTDLDLLVDAGISNLQDAKKIVSYGVSNLIIGTETLDNLLFVEEAVDFFGGDTVTVSLDIKNGKVLNKLNDNESMGLIPLILELQKIGVTQIILLDLDRVGSNQGVDAPLIKKIMANTRMRVFVGGGIRDLEEILRLKDLGVFGVLVASVLHSGKVSTSNL
jgi:phosphoribosylformimino-5-aminoimidazole carboxamide ribotide isomerase